MEERVLGRILGYGTVVVRGTEGTPEPFDAMAHPMEFRKQIQQQIEKSPGKLRYQIMRVAQIVALTYLDEVEPLL